MVAKGLTEPVSRESTFKFSFPDCDKLPPPVLPFVDVSFSYSGKKEDYLYSVSLHCVSILCCAADAGLPVEHEYAPCCTVCWILGRCFEGRQACRRWATYCCGRGRNRRH